MSPTSFHRRQLPEHRIASRCPVSGASLRSRGFTLTELLIVVIIIGLLAVVATPALRSADPNKVDLAATQLAEALRFARSEAMRTGQVHSVQVRRNEEDFAAEKTDLSLEPAGAEFVLRHPVTKQLFEQDFDDPGPVLGVDISNSQDAFHYAGLGRRQRLMFDANGQPVYIKPIAGETYHLTNASIRLKLGDHQLQVRVAPYTGRVTIQ